MTVGLLGQRQLPEHVHRRDCLCAPQHLPVHIDVGHREGRPVAHRLQLPRWVVARAPIGRPWFAG